MRKTRRVVSDELWSRISQFLPPHPPQPAIAAHSAIVTTSVNECNFVRSILGSDSRPKMVNIAKELCNAMGRLRAMDSNTAHLQAPLIPIPSLQYFGDV